MSLSSGKQRLAAITKDLWARWVETKQHWQDARSLEFERDYLLELESGVERATAVIDQLDKLITKIRSECE